MYVYSGLKSKKVQFREAAFFASSKAKINLCLKFFSNEAALKGPKEWRMQKTLIWAFEVIVQLLVHSIISALFFAFYPIVGL